MRFLPAALSALMLLVSCSTVVAAKVQHVSVRVNGMKRTSRMYVPRAYDGTRKVSLVIVLHGGVGCGWSAEWDSRMSKRAEKDNFIAAYPNGWLRSWNADECCGPARLKHIDDVAFMRALIAKCKERYAVDTDRVYVTGISNGGMLAYKMALEMPEDIAAIAPVEGCMYESAGNPTASSPVSVVAVHGTADRIVRYNGGAGALFGYKVTSPSVESTIKFWADRDKCSPTAAHEDGEVVTKDTYTGGANGTEVCLYTVKNSGHVWPGGRRCIFLGDRPKQDWSATDAICAFFWAHPKQR